MKNYNPRIIPVVLHKDGRIVKSRNFNFFQSVGDPFSLVKRYNSWNLDELIYLNISDNKSNFFYEEKNITTSSTASRKTQKSRENNKNIFKFLKQLSSQCRMPLTYGGGIKTINTARKILKSGADKFAINTIAIENPNFIKHCSKEFGSQSVVVSIDCKKISGKYTIFYDNGRKKSKKNLVYWIKEIQKLGAGEILMNSIDRDGTGLGFDIKLLKILVKYSNIPIIFMGGAKNKEDFKNILKFKPSGIAAANIFQFTELSYKNIKEYLHKFNKNIRYEK